MDANARYELNCIKKELDSIISELESIRNGVKKDFAGIGNEQCAVCIDRVLNKYYYVSRCLRNLDTTTVTEEFAEAHGGGGGCF